MFKILIPPDIECFQTAAEILRDYARRITGRTPEIVFSDDPSSDLIVPDINAQTPFAANLLLEGLMESPGVRSGTDDYAITSLTVGGRTVLLISGGRLRSLYYGIYDYLERCGCAWFWDEDLVPEKEALPLTGFLVRESPRFQYRGLRYFAHRSLHRFQAEHWTPEDWKKEIDYLLKKRLNLFMLRTGQDDLFQKAFPDIVPYPAPFQGESDPSAARSFDDRTPFLTLEARSQLRKEILQYARERDLMHPEDVGTMTHWYSRTPAAFLEKVKPDFMPQSNNQYAERSGLVWDIRQEANLERYFALTAAHIRHYGKAEIFHTVGLAERMCFADRRKNHELKLYTYRRIITRLRREYPDAPLLIASWDFICNWKTEEVRALVAGLDPANTILFDYTSDSVDELHNFRNWGVCGRFPWIFGIFHAFETNSELRGNYEVLERRLPLAAEDPMCKGMVFWPENSHTDPLMFEYFASNSWKPDSVRIEDVLEAFCRKRYPGAAYDVMAPLWRTSLPLIRCNFWRQNQSHVVRGCLCSDFVFRMLLWDQMSNLDAVILENHAALSKELRKGAAHAPELLRAAALLPPETAGLPQVRRDRADLARTAVSRVSNYACQSLALRMEAWRRGEDDGESVLAYARSIRRLTELEMRLLGSHEDFSLYASLKRILAIPGSNPDFEATLKGNAENAYCRSFIYELFKGCYLPEFDVYYAWLESVIRSKKKITAWQHPEKLFAGAQAEIRDRFYATPLSSLAPDAHACEEKLSATLTELAETAEFLLKNAAGE